jgi:hypothetical protein
LPDNQTKRGASFIVVESQFPARATTNVRAPMVVVIAVLQH